MTHHHTFKHGWRNKYRRSMPWAEVISKDLSFALRDAWNWLRNGGKLPVLLVIPQFPSSRTSLYKIARALRCRLTNRAVKAPALIIYFNDHTHSPEPEIPVQYRGIRLLNAQCTDISKTHVDEVHSAVFGYNTRIDPRLHQGNAVVKSNSNAMHDGHIVHCPLSEVPEDTICQLLINNAFNEEWVVDYRVPVIGGAIPLVYLKFKSFHQRFTNHVAHTEMKRPAEVFSQTELDQLRRFALAMKADFCEFDVLRHKENGLIYVIDVNKTPYGPPKGLAAQEQAVRLLSDCFREKFLS